MHLPTNICLKSRWTFPTAWMSCDPVQIQWNFLHVLFPVVILPALWFLAASSGSLRCHSSSCRLTFGWLSGLHCSCSVCHRLSAPGAETSANLKPTPSCVLSQEQFVSEAFFWCGRLFFCARGRRQRFGFPPFEKTPERRCQTLTGCVETKRICVLQSGERAKWDVGTLTAKPAALWITILFTARHRKCHDSAHKIFLLFFFSLVADMAQKKKKNGW